jgi:serine protease
MRRLLIPAAVVIAGLTASALQGRAQSAPTPHHLLADSASAARVVKAWNEHRSYIPGEVLVKFRDGVGVTAQSRALSTLRGGVTGNESVWIGDALLARTPSEADAEAAAAVLVRQPEVEWAQPNYLRELHSVPNDPSYARQWNLEMIDAPRAWDINPGATADVIVAVLDSGVTTTSTSFPMTLWTGDTFERVDIPVATSPDIASARILPGRDFVFWSGPVIDFVGHGTHIAGTVLQETNNAFGLSGIAYRARLMPLKVCYGYWEIQFLQSAAGIPGFVDPAETGSCPDSAVSEAIRYAVDNGAQIINLSLGGPDPSPIAREALEYAVSRGVFVAVSNGNQYERGNAIQYPAADAAALNGVVSVGAVGRTGRRSFYSGTGRHLEIVAPGGDAREGGVPGSIFQVGLLTTAFDPETVVTPRFDRYVEVPMQGTSMATPHVAGLAALLVSQGIRNPGAIEAALRKFARDAGVPGRDDEYGDGLIDARATLRGFGLAR